MGAFVAICFGYVAGSMIIVLRLQRIFVRYAVIALVFNVGLNLIFVPKYGYMAAAWITLITEVLVQILSLRAVFRALEMKPKFGRFVRIAAAALGMGLAVWGLNAAGAPLAVLVLAAAVTYPPMLLLCGPWFRRSLAFARREAQE